MSSNFLNFLAGCCMSTKIDSAAMHSARPLRALSKTRRRYRLRVAKLLNERLQYRQARLELGRVIPPALDGTRIHWLGDGFVRRRVDVLLAGPAVIFEHHIIPGQA